METDCTPLGILYHYSRRASVDEYSIGGCSQSKRCGRYISNIEPCCLLAIIGANRPVSSLIDDEWYRIQCRAAFIGSIDAHGPLTNLARSNIEADDSLMLALAMTVPASLVNRIQPLEVLALLRSAI